MSETFAKTVLVTGCTSGIGLETTKHLYSLGYKLFLVGRDPERLKEVAEQTGHADYFVCDLENTDKICEVFSYCIDHGIKLCGMVHAAGYAINMPIRSFKAAEMERLMKIHYFAFAELCKGFYTKKVSEDCSSIIGISSYAVRTGKKGSTFYAASKNALNMAVKVASKEFVNRGIRVNAILPAYVDTRMNKGIEELIDVKKEQPMGLIPPQEIAYLVEFLISDKAKYITGALIPVSAGMEE